MKFWAAFLAILVTGAAFGQEDPRTRPGYYVSGFFGRSLLILGSKDQRTGGGFSVEYGKPEPRFQIKSIPAQLVYELYADRTYSHGISREGPNQTWGLGFLALARHRWPLSPHGVGFFTDLGFGVHYEDIQTHDLPTHFNTTPTIGFGIAFPGAHGHEWLVGLRLLHISNGGTGGHSEGSNPGQNQVLATVGYRF